MTGPILAGTASWTDKSLIASKRFYPSGCTSAEERLRFYASRFPLTEVDSSFYAMPSAANSALWVERTPADFTFNVKAFRTLTTHQTPPAALPADLRKDIGATTKKNVYAKDLPAPVVDELWARYRRAVQPLADAGKLGALHFQFPPWFTARRDTYAYLDQVRERLPGYTVAVEFRHKSWFAPEGNEGVLKFLRERAFVNVVVDEPQNAANSIPSVWEVTNPDLAIVRLHGRNEGTWNIKGATAASDRFNYEYSQGELEGLAGSIKALSTAALRTHVVVNVNYQDQGIRSAATLKDLLSD